MTLNLLSARNWKHFLRTIITKYKTNSCQDHLSIAMSIGFFDIINPQFSKLDINNNEIYILDDFNINLYLNNSFFFQKNNLLQSQ